MTRNALPDTLSAAERSIMEAFMREVEPEDLSLYIEKAEEHLHETHEARLRGAPAAEGVASRILEALLKLEEGWEHYSDFQRRLLCAMLRYFARNFDEISDMESEIGFDDDAEVVNACLALYGREDLRISLSGEGY